MKDEKVSTENFKDQINPDSWIVKEGFVENYLKDVSVEDKFQFIRNGYYTVDKDSKGNDLIFNRIVGLKSSFNV
jgi:glutaminyl-tRNA synthetase